MSSLVSMKTAVSDRTPSLNRTKAVLHLLYPNSNAGPKLLSWPAVRFLIDCDLKSLPHWDRLNMPVEKWLTDISNDFKPSLAIYDRAEICYSSASSVVEGH